MGREPQLLPLRSLESASGMRVQDIAAWMETVVSLTTSIKSLTQMKLQKLKQVTASMKQLQ